jgi:riboflavin kinase/FMN adenylyltransferase
VSIRVVRDWRNLPDHERGASVALGNFDGVHLGHQRVIAAAGEAARQAGAPLGVVSFEPHPRLFFQPDAEPFRVMTPGQQSRALAALGVDLFYELPFGAEMAGMSDSAFVEDVLVAGLGVRWVAVGFDVTYGKGRTGGPAELKAAGERLGFGVSVVERVDDAGGEKLSSSAVRDALHAGEPEQAAAILGRPFAIEGQVVHGDKRGREIGVPTANVRLGDYVRPKYGIYAVRVRLPDGRMFDGVANLGVRPMFQSPEPLLEAWLFGFDGDLYGQVIETELVAFLRPEMDFDSLEGLKVQIDQDAAAARTVLSDHYYGPHQTAVARLNQLLDLPASGREQDWEIELADPERLPEFLDAFESASLTMEERAALGALIVGSVDAVDGPEIPQPLFDRARAALRGDPHIQAKMQFLWLTHDRAVSPDRVKRLLN